MAAFLTEVPVQLTFHGVDQKTGENVIQIPGRLTEALNVVQRLGKVYGKRDGFGVFDKLTDTGTITTGQGLASANNLPVVVADSTFYNRDTTAGRWRNRGSQTRAFATDTVALPKVAARPFCIVQSGLIYEFSAATVSTNGGYYYRITDEATGVEVVPMTFVQLWAGGTASTIRVIADGGYVWLIYKQLPGAGLQVNAARYNPATPSAAPTVTTFFAPSAGPTSVTWDVVKTVNGIAFAVVNDTGVGGGITISGVTSQMWFALLDPTTGLAKASPGWVAFAGSHAANCRIGWMSYDGTAGFIFLGTIIPATTAKLTRVNAATLAATERNLTGTSYAAATNRQINGYSNDGDIVQVLVSDASASVENAIIHKHQHVWSTNTTTNTNNWLRQATLAVEPFRVSGTTYLITSYDDANNLQRSYCLRTASDGKILARALYSRGGNVFNKGSGSFEGITAANVSGNTVYVALVANDGVDGEWHTRRVTWNLAESYGPLRAVMNEQVAVVAGGWPVRLGDRDATIADLVPMMYPRTITTSTVVTGGATLNGTYTLAICYSASDGRGNVYRSALCPSVTQAVSAGNALRITAPTLRTGQNLTTFSIEVYLSQAGQTSLFLAKTVANDPTVDTLTIDLTAPPTTGAELAYSSGGVLLNSPPPPFRIAAQWRSRLIVSDTDVEGETWVTKEIQTGRGPEFSANLSLALPGGTGRIRAMGEVDDNFFALLKQDAIYVLEGQGPNDKGQDQYTTRQVPGANGSRNPNSTVTTPLGLFFQAIDGRIYLLDRNLTVVSIGRGVDTHKTATVTAAVHDADASLVLFFTDTAKVLVFDYANPVGNPAQPEETLGQWYVWSIPTAAVAAAMVGQTVHYVDATGTVWQQVEDQRYDQTNTAILPKLVVAPIPFSGINGYQMVTRVIFQGEYKGPHSIQFTLSGDAGQTTDTPPAKAMAAGPQVLEVRPENTRKCSALEVTIEEAASGNLTEGFTFEGLAFAVATMPGLRRLNVSQRL